MAVPLVTNGDGNHAAGLAVRSGRGPCPGPRNAPQAVNGTTSDCVNIGMLGLLPGSSRRVPEEPASVFNANPTRYLAGRPLHHVVDRRRSY